MALKSSHSGIINRLKVKETSLIIGISCFVGIAFNFFWVNRVPFITPSKAEICEKRNTYAYSGRDKRET